MRDPMLDVGNAYITAYQKAGEAGRGQAEELAEAADIVSGLTGWCRLALYDTGCFQSVGRRPGPFRPARASIRPVAIAGIRENW